MIWKKLGLVYCADGQRDWAWSHAYVPTSMMLSEDCIRVYVAFLDRAKVGRIGYVDLDARNPLHILRISENPTLDIGEPGAFDDSGVTPMCILKDRSRLYLFYVGWQLGVTVRYFLFVGLAISEDNGESFKKYSRAPILDRSDEGLFARTAAHVHRDHGRWKMWYMVSNQWIDVKDKQVPSYTMRYLESTDGVSWGKEGLVCLKPSVNDEFGFGRPFIINEDGLYRMWYSIRTLSRGYRLGYAESYDGRSWVRKDEEVGIDVSEGGWDSQMICFACVQKTQYGTYMFYNGNNYGESGFGLAILSR